jgi:hypothetical protein
MVIVCSHVPVCSHPFRTASAVASGLLTYPNMTMGDLEQTSPWTPGPNDSPVATSTICTRMLSNCEQINTTTYGKMSNYTFRRTSCLSDISTSSVFVDMVSNYCDQWRLDLGQIRRCHFHENMAVYDGRYIHTTDESRAEITAIYARI